jgi:putative membrane protein
MLAVAPAHEAVRFVPLLVAAVLAGGRQHGQWWLAGALALVLGLGALRWLTTRYRVTAERMELHSGLLFRQHRSVPRDRIRTVDVTARLLHRVFGLGVLRIGTGRNEPGHEGELTLDAVSAAEAERLRAVLLDRSTAATAHTADRAGAAAAPDAAATTPAEAWASQCSSDETRDATAPGPARSRQPHPARPVVRSRRPNPGWPAARWPRLRRSRRASSWPGCPGRGCGSRR